MNADEDRCICCGEPVPEGRQVCHKCEAAWGKFSQPQKVELSGRKIMKAYIADGLRSAAVWIGVGILSALLIWGFCIAVKACAVPDTAPEEEIAEDRVTDPPSPQAEPEEETAAPAEEAAEPENLPNAAAVPFECGEGALNEKAIHSTVPRESVRITGANGCTAWAWELDELTAIVWLEVRGESDYCQRLVTQSILNRQSFGYWGGSLHGVLSAVEEDGSLAYTTWPHLYEAEPDAEFRAMVWDVFLYGETLAPRIMWFHAGSYHAWEGAVPEFCVDNTYFSSSVWAEVDG